MSSTPDRMQQIVRTLRQNDSTLSLYDAVCQARQIVDVVDDDVRDRMSDSTIVRIGRSVRSMNGRQVDLLCSAQYSTLALETSLAREEKADVAGRRAQRG